MMIGNEALDNECAEVLSFDDERKVDNKLESKTYVATERGRQKRDGG
jgi:hypothetical protein